MLRLNPAERCDGRHKTNDRPAGRGVSREKETIYGKEETGHGLFLLGDFHLLGKITHFYHERTHKRFAQTVGPLKAK